MATRVVCTVGRAVTKITIRWDDGTHCTVTVMNYIADEEIRLAKESTKQQWFKHLRGQ